MDIERNLGLNLKEICMLYNLLKNWGNTVQKHAIYPTLNAEMHQQLLKIFFHYFGRF